MAYFYCFKQEDICGPEYMTASASEQYITVHGGMDVANDKFCTYQIFPNASLGNHIEVQVDFYFLANLFIFNGTDITTAGNQTTPSKFRDVFRFEVSNTSNNNVYLVVYPSDQRSLPLQYPESFGLTYKMVNYTAPVVPVMETSTPSSSSSTSNATSNSTSSNDTTNSNTTSNSTGSTSSGSSSNSASTGSTGKTFKLTM